MAPQRLRKGGRVESLSAEKEKGLDRKEIHDGKYRFVCMYVQI